MYLVYSQSTDRFYYFVEFKWEIITFKTQRVQVRGVNTLNTRVILCPIKFEVLFDIFIIFISSQISLKYFVQQIVLIIFFTIITRLWE